MIDTVVCGLLYLLSTAQSTNTFYGTNKYVEYTPGDTNLIITVPHDGYIQPDSIANRTDGCRDKIGGICQYPWTEDCPSKGPTTDEWYCRATTYSDTFTQIIGRRFIEEFVALTGKTPYFILDNLHRSKMDPNREIIRAAHGNKEAEKAYNEFHNFIVQAQAAMGGPGLLVDFHGHTHPHEKIEIGYLYKPQDLNAGDYSKDVSSINALIVRIGLPVTELLYGNQSLGAMFEREGYHSIPSPRQPEPGEDKYFRGGKITQTHGSRDGGEVDAVQIEIPLAIREGEEVNRETFTEKLAKVIAQYHQRYYSVSASTCPAPKTWGIVLAIGVISVYFCHKVYLF